MILGLALPAAILMLAAILAVRAFERVLPETLAGLGVIFVISTLLLWGLSTLLFGLLYHWQGAPLETVFGPGEGLAHLAGVGAKSGLLWLPIIAIAVSTAPRRWKHNTW